MSREKTPRQLRASQDDELDEDAINADVEDEDDVEDDAVDTSVERSSA